MKLTNVSPRVWSLDINKGEAVHGQAGEYFASRDRENIA